MSEQNPAIFLQAGSHPAEDVRRWMYAVTRGREGLINASDFLVAENGTPNMSVDISAGQAYINGTEAVFQGAYFVESRATVNLIVAASDPTNDRIDLVVAQVEDSAYSGAIDAWKLAVVTGTAAASPVAPAMPDTAFLLATLDVQSSSTSVTDTNITDDRSTFDSPALFTQSSNPATDGTDWESVAYEARLMPNGLLTIYVSSVRKNSVLSAGGGNISNQVIATMPSVIRGKRSQAFPLSSGASGQMMSGYYRPDTGAVGISATTESDIAIGETISVGGTLQMVL